jgi:hypothetical protein
MTSRYPQLREVVDRLELPQPVRARVILELASDLADFESELMASGLSAEEARARAARMLIPSPDALSELQDLHRPLYARLVDRFADPARHGLERVALFAASIGLFGLALSRLVGTGLLDSPAPLTLAVLAVGFCVAVLCTWKGFALFVARHHELKKLERGLWLLPVAAAAAIALAGTGLVFDLYGVAGRLEADLSGQVMVLVRWLRRDMGLLSAGLLTALTALGMWLFLSAGVARARQAEADLLAGLDLETRAETMKPKGDER